MPTLKEHLRVEWEALRKHGKARLENDSETNKTSASVSGTTGVDGRNRAREEGTEDADIESIEGARKRQKVETSS